MGKSSPFRFILIKGMKSMTEKERKDIEEQIAALKKEKADLEILAQMQDNFQHAYKIFLNSVYGFTGTKYSPVFNRDIAESVTLTGQETIKEMVRFTNDELNKLVENEDGNGEWIVAGDTDSVGGDSIVIINGKKMTIEEAYELAASDDFIEVSKNGTEVAFFGKDVLTPRGADGEEAQIVNISRHKVTKPRWEISVPGQHPLSVTEDHSIKVLRNNEIVDVKPSEILKTDSIIVIEVV